jgi:hypothetical protein
MSLPRLLAIMGSGETSPTMVKTHRALLDRVGLPAVLLDTPFGFQENADELCAKAVAYFRDSVGREIGVASYRAAAEAGTLAYETMLAQLRAAHYVFAGPGSPSYALRHWRGTPVHDLLAEKLRGGGAVVFASAAALTLGRFTIPVYEIYKVGESPHWLEGLDLLAEAGLAAAVVPHFDNAEGGTHDTRYCYMGERRLRALEAQLPPEAFVLGVDEHTACVIDLDAGTLAVGGLGGVTVRRHGRSVTFEAGATVPLAALRERAEADLGAPLPAAATDGEPDAPAPREAARRPARSPLLDELERAETAFADALAARDADRAAEALLELEDAIARWSTETFSGDEMARARRALRAMVVALAGRARDGLADPAERLGPFIDALLAARAQLRAARAFELADALRDRLVALGVEVHDTPAGTTWELRGPR